MPRKSKPLPDSREFETPHAGPAEPKGAPAASPAKAGVASKKAPTSRIAKTRPASKIVNDEKPSRPRNTVGRKPGQGTPQKDVKQVRNVDADGLNPREARFVQEYLTDLNATQAAIRAGYSASTADGAGPHLVKKPKISVVIAKRLAVSAAKAQLTVERIDREIARLSFADMRLLFKADGSMKPMSEWSDDIAAAIGSVETEENRKGGLTVRLRKIKAWDKSAALALAARRMGLLKDKIEVSGTIDLAERVRRAKARSSND